ncbi:MAG: hydroxyacylglutathione hydrolase [Gammaproteobacteria bacterium CG11_big_fil_rev_8_21_14_0_20_46_22]|nr:MAG: hydroxyacylglutathione hydrolase [Gammaproteobacteria bacterium CG12_big_fil_rev_8_21_14_0_65_46_12]PIR12012.1 MAG: hydroxyacylglutathione hydrolase [Gammaproteobacteria bacterium CG11_big_fil_rev_8_21_14_0_20_46_22]
MDIKAIKAFKGNYIWAMTQEGKAVVVDPGDAKPVFDFLDFHALSLQAILITHHHNDHTGGILALQSAFPGIAVYGPNNHDIKGITHPVLEGDSLSVLNKTFKVIEVPGHTLDHIAYLNAEIVFCGDTLFSAGCGRLFEGSYEQLRVSLNRLKALPEHTQLYPTHEYTLSNLAFATFIEPENKLIQQHIAHCQALRAKDLPTLPTTVELEKKINPFLRTDQASVIQKACELGASSTDALAIFTALRAAKNDYKS